jgi:hypothetical protein
VVELINTIAGQTNRNRYEAPTSRSRG